MIMILRVTNMFPWQCHSSSIRIEIFTCRMWAVFDTMLSLMLLGNDTHCPGAKLMSGMMGKYQATLYGFPSSTTWMGLFSFNPGKNHKPEHSRSNFLYAIPLYFCNRTLYSFCVCLHIHEYMYLYTHMYIHSTVTCMMGSTQCCSSGVLHMFLWGRFSLSVSLSLYRSLSLSLTLGLSCRLSWLAVSASSTLRLHMYAITPDYVFLKKVLNWGLCIHKASILMNYLPSPVHSFKNTQRLNKKSR